MYGCENWTIKKADYWRTDAFELWCWRRLLRVPLDSKAIKPINPKGNQPWYSLERLMLKLQYFGHLMQRADSLERPWGWERVTAREGGDRGWDGWMASLTQWPWVWASSEIVKDREAWCAEDHGVTKSWIQLRDWTTTTILHNYKHIPEWHYPLFVQVIYNIKIYYMISQLWNSQTSVCRERNHFFSKEASIPRFNQHQCI